MAIPGDDKGPFVDLHPWERHYVFWFEGLADADADGLCDGVEIRLGTNIRAADTDLDGVDDWDEVFRFGTDPLQTPWPDLTVSSIQLSPANPRVGVRVTVSATIRNLSSTTPAGPTTSGWRLVHGGLPTTFSRPVLELAPEASQTVQWGFTPTKTDVGGWTVTVTADSEDALVESDETNNQRSISFSIPVP